MAKDYDDDIRRLHNAKRTHFTHFTVPELPWHKKDEEVGADSGGPAGSKPDGEESLEPASGRGTGASRTPDVPRQHKPIGRPRAIDYGRCRVCRDYAVWANGGFLYCHTCWKAVEEDFNG